jgi:hypothetical protein
MRSFDIRSPIFTKTLRLLYTAFINIVYTLNDIVRYEQNICFVVRLKGRLL